MLHNIPHPPSPQIVIEILFGASPLMFLWVDRYVHSGLFCLVEMGMITNQILDQQSNDEVVMKLSQVCWNKPQYDGMIGVRGMFWVPDFKKRNKQGACKSKEGSSTSRYIINPDSKECNWRKIA